MKLFIPFFFATTFLCQGQIINFPDINFKNAILREYPDTDANGDGEISISEAHAFWNFMHLPNSNISDLTGIEHFTSISWCIFDNNNIAQVDLSNNVNITSLSIVNNNLTQLDLTDNINLESLHASSNQLIAINLSASNLRSLNVPNNQLTTINLSGHPNLKWLTLNNNQFTNLDLTANTKLISLYCANNQLTELDLVVNQFYGTGSEFILDCSNNNLTDLSIISTTPGIFHRVKCSGNLFTELNLSESRVTVLDCSDNPLLENINWRNGWNYKFDPNNADNNFENLPNLSTVCYGPGFYQELQDFIIADVGHSVDFYNNETCDALSVNENNLNVLSITPNPAESIITIQASTPINQVDVFNELGQVVLSKSLNTAMDKLTVDISALGHGLYFVKITDVSGNSTLKKVIKN